MFDRIFSRATPPETSMTTGVPSSISADGAVLHLPRRVSLGVDVRDLLQLESPFQRHGEQDSAREEENVLRVVEPLGQFEDGRLEAEGLGDLSGKEREMAKLLANRLAGDGAALLPQRQAKEPRAAICAVNVFVAATPISIPARV